MERIFTFNLGIINLKVCDYLRKHQYVLEDELDESKNHSIDEFIKINEMNGCFVYDVTYAFFEEEFNEMSKFLRRNDIIGVDDMMRYYFPYFIRERDYEQKFKYKKHRVRHKREIESVRVLDGLVKLIERELINHVLSNIGDAIEIEYECYYIYQVDINVMGIRIYGDQRARELVKLTGGKYAHEFFHKPIGEEFDLAVKKIKHNYNIQNEYE